MTTRQVWAGAVVLILGAGQRGRADDWTDRLNQLEQRQNVLERRYEVDLENAANKAKEAGVVVAKDGFGLKSVDGQYTLKLSGDLQADGRFFLNDDRDSAKSLTDTFLFRRIRPTVEVTVAKWVTGRVQPNFGGGAATVDDANINLAFRPWAQARVGRFKSPVGLENLKSSARLTFIERALPTGLVANYDLGASLWGETWNGRAAYTLSATNGAVDGGNVDGSDGNDRKDFAGRLFLTPFKTTARPALANLGVGFAASTGRQSGTAAAPGLTSGYRTHSQNTYFGYLGRAVANGNRTRWSPQLSWTAGRWGVLAEHVSSRQAVRSTVTLATADLLHRSWQVAASYVLTGEDVTDKGVKPRHPYEPGKPGRGAWEIGVRVAQFDAAEGTFGAVGANRSFASPTASARAARAWTGGLNWYANNNLKIQANIEQTAFDGGATGGSRALERAVLTRVQFAY